VVPVLQTTKIQSEDIGGKVQRNVGEAEKDATYSWLIAMKTLIVVLKRNRFIVNADIS
jgi:hypothetical protein